MSLDRFAAATGGLRLGNMRFVVISVDYEIFGNGTGDVRQHILDPTERMANICEKHHVPLTVFFEAEEYVSFVSYAGALKQELGYDPAMAIRGQVIRLFEAGHDVQLHLHPEWHGARYEEGRWLLKPGQVTVDGLFESQEETTRYIAQRKGLIEEMAAAANRRRTVKAYRAGAFSAQPGAKLLRALAENGIMIDSSAVKGLCNPRRGYDYSSAPSAKGPWRVRKDVAFEEDGGPVWEFPIYSIRGRRFRQLTPMRLLAKFSRNVPKNKQREMMNQLGVRPRNPFNFLGFLWQSVPIKADYHNVLPNTVARWIAAAPPAPAGSPDVVMLIGHTKEHRDDRSFRKLLELISQRRDWKVIALNDLAKMLGNGVHPVGEPFKAMA